MCFLTNMYHSTIYTTYASPQHMLLQDIFYYTIYGSAQCIRRTTPEHLILELIVVCIYTHYTMETKTYYSLKAHTKLV